MIHDKELLRRRFSRHLEGYNTLASVQRNIARRLSLEILLHAPRDLRRGVEIGAGTGFLTRHLVSYYPIAHFIANDLVGESRDYMPPKVEFIEGDGEHINIPHGVDLIASASTVQWFDDLQGFMARAAEALRDGGVLALSTFGPDNFGEITATTGHRLDYKPIDQITEWVKDLNMELIHSEEWIHTEHYRSPRDVLHHLRATGVNALEHTPWTPARLRRFEADYTNHCAEMEVESGVSLTFHPMMIIARKPFDN